MKLTKFFKQQVQKWNEENKCGHCYEFHAPLTEEALNKQQLIDPCCIQVMLTRDRGQAFGVEKEYNNVLGVLSNEYYTKAFTLYVMKPQGININNYDEILGHSIDESKSELLDDLEECINEMELDFCEFIGQDWQVRQWSAFQLLNYRDNNYTGWRLSVTLRKRKGLNKKVPTI